MRHVAIDNVVPGMITGVHIYTPGDTRGIPLVARGVTITEALQHRLRRSGVESILVEDTLSHGIDPSPSITDEIRRQAITTVQETFSRSKANDNNLPYDQVEKVESTINAILTEISSRKNLLVCLSDLNVFGGARMQHAINVCVVGCNVGRAYFAENGWRDFRGQRRDDGIPDRLQKLGVGLLLQDIGALAIPDEIWAKNGMFSADERDIVQQHPTLGIEMLEAADVSPLTKVTIAQHHERFDGSGYPRGLAGDKIHDHGQIAAIAETYVSLCDGVQAGHKPLPAHKAYEMVTKAAGRMFSPEVVAAFEAAVAPFGPGEAVVMTDGSSGLVIRNHADAPRCPMVRVTHDSEGVLIANPPELDTREDASPQVVRAAPALPSDAVSSTTTHATY
jgi:HD-GYP domain-containing protein (c-di-GMP phosphodiesterase class II)